MFLIIGLIGIKNFPLKIRPINLPQETMAVDFQPPPPPETPQVVQEQPEEIQNQPTDVPQVAAVVAVQNSPDVAFAVPVPNATAVAKEARLATPPPAVITQAPSGPVKFNPQAAGSEGTFPPPEYPRIAKQNQQQGTVIIRIQVAASGELTSVKVEKSSGFALLDDAALRVVKNRWRFLPGQQKDLIWPCTFQLQ
jgi:protein TonB